MAFAGNSVLCRLALGEDAIDAASFTVIRMLAGITVLAVILILRSNHKSVKNDPVAKGSWLASVMLFIYALTFSYAYLSLDTGTGALILFGSVQLTMLLIGMITGNRLHYSELVGVLTAFSGFVFLVAPNLNSPSITGFILMSVAGVAWAFYTLKGRSSEHPMIDTAYNFLRTLPLVILLLAITIQNAHLTSEGIMYAVLSGALASGIGYAIWYMALRGLSVTQAAVVQLLVPIIAAMGGVIFAGEVISARLVTASIMVLGGILIVVLGRYYFLSRTEKELKQK